MSTGDPGDRDSWGLPRTGHPSEVPSQEGKGLKLSSAKPPRGLSTSRVPLGLEWVVRAAVCLHFSPRNCPRRWAGGGGQGCWDSAPSLWKLVRRVGGWG